MARVALNIADLFEHAVDAAPSRPALKVGDRMLTYADLEADANRLAEGDEIVLRELQRRLTQDAS